MLTEVQLSNKRLVKAQKRAARKHPMGHATRYKQYNENILAEARKEYMSYIIGQQNNRKTVKPGTVWNKIQTFFRRKTV